MRKYLLDTNFILRFLLKDIPDQVKTVKEFFVLAKEGKVSLFVPVLVIIEIDFALRKYYKFQKAKVVKKLEFILKTPYFEIEKREIMLNVLSDYKNNNMDLVDILLIHEAKLLDRELLTFDKKLKTLR